MKTDLKREKQELRKQIKKKMDAENIQIFLKQNW